MRTIADIAQQYRGLQGDMPPFGDVITLLNDRRRIAMAIRDILIDHSLTIGDRASQRLQFLAAEIKETDR